MAEKKPARKPVPPPLPPRAKPSSPPKPEPKGQALERVADSKPTVIGVPAIADPRTPVAQAPARIKTEKMAAIAPPATSKIAAAPEPKRQIETLLGMPAPEPPPAQAEPARAGPPPTQRPEDEEVLLPIARSELKKRIDAILEGPRPRLYAFAGVAAAVVLVFLGVIIKLAAGPNKEQSAPQAAASTASATVTFASASAAAPPPPPLPKPITCVLSGDSKAIAPQAAPAAGLEVVGEGSSIRIGYAIEPNRAAITELEPSSLAVASTRTLDAPGPIKRVTPTASGSVAIDVDGDADVLRLRRIVGAGAGAYDVGTTNGELAWAPHGTSDAKPLWKVDGNAESIRGASRADALAIAYKQGGAMSAGVVRGAALEPKSSPVHVAGEDTELGSPAIAWSGESVVVAWAEKSQALWKLRLFVWHPGEDPKAQSFDPPAGGPGDNVIAPSLTSLDNGYILLLWTEGPMSKQQVRAQVLAPDGSRTGSVLTVSTPSTRAGQGRAAISNGKGVVAYLSGSGSPFEVRAVKIDCN